MVVQRGRRVPRRPVGHSASMAASTRHDPAPVQHEEGQQPALERAVGRDVVAGRVRALGSARAPRCAAGRHVPSSRCPAVTVPAPGRRRRPRPPVDRGGERPCGPGRWWVLMGAVGALVRATSGAARGRHRARARHGRARHRQPAADPAGLRRRLVRAGRTRPATALDAHDDHARDRPGGRRAGRRPDRRHQPARPGCAAGPPQPGLRPPAEPVAAVLRHGPDRRPPVAPVVRRRRRPDGGHGDAVVDPVEHGDAGQRHRRHDAAVVATHPRHVGDGAAVRAGHPRRRAPARGLHRPYPGGDGRHDGGHPGDVVGVGHHAVQAVRAPGRRGRQVRGSQQPPRRSRDPTAGDRSGVLLRRADLPRRDTR